MSGESYCPECSGVFTGLPHSCSSVGLTDEEIVHLVDKWSFEDKCTDHLLALWIAKAQIKKVHNWGEELCDIHQEAKFKRQCGLCWQEL